MCAWPVAFGHVERQDIMVESMEDKVAHFMVARKWWEKEEKAKVPMSSSARLPTYFH